MHLALRNAAAAQEAVQRVPKEFREVAADDAIWT